ncbi:hypothetical protein EVAR_14363_1 [Eumeta japonica]|uniref:Uncharacterized protein n=1 Tax=Eumeta variegata TaxID=151549 RepID=A0A4C1TX08_EUMVA|nr:hypothetical protein EVAR_14363_1 [Eumeta japonica]
MEKRSSLPLDASLPGESVDTGALVSLRVHSDGRHAFRINQACRKSWCPDLRVLLDYGTVRLSPRTSKSHIVTFERQYKQAPKVAGNFQRSLRTQTLWEMLGIDL